MTLESFRRERIVVQRPDASVANAACAMETNHVGVVLVAERGRPIGLLTDRDIVLRVVARGLDPRGTELRQVMTPDPAMLPIDGTEQEALELMRKLHVRRIPLLEDERIAGMVTLDDLIMDESTDLRSVGALVRAQLEEPASRKPAGITHPSRPAPRPETALLRARRHDTHAGRTLRHALLIVQEETGIDEGERALTALLVVLGGLVRRITPPEAGDLLSQLPSEVRERLLASGVAGGPDRDVTTESMELEMQERLGIARAQAASLVEGVAAAVTRIVGDGEMQHVRGQLPSSMRPLFELQVEPF